MFEQQLQHPLFHTIGALAAETDTPAYLIGGYVRDLLLERPTVDIDIVVLGDGPTFASALAKRLGRRTPISIYRNYGTAQVRHHGTEIEIVGARRESYTPASRNPQVSQGTLQDDQNRRDFTINALAISLNPDTWGQLLDPFNGIADLNNKTIRTPLDPAITFSDDPLRMMRAIRFAAQLSFYIETDTFDAIAANRERISIVSKERISTELNKILLSPNPAYGLILLERSGLLALILPEIDALKGVDTMNGISHKDNFEHTLKVLEKISSRTDNLWLRWAALLHDVGKPRVKQWNDTLGWTFHNHDFIGARMVPHLFRRMKLPMGAELKFVQKMVELHMRPIVLSEDTVTDSAVRRLLFDAGDDIDSLMTLCEADITSNNKDKVKRFLNNFQLVRQKLKDIEEKDRIRNFQPPVDGSEIMDTFQLPPCHLIGEIKATIKEAILDGQIPNEHDAAFAFMMQKYGHLKK